MAKHIIDRNTIHAPANIKLAEGRTEKGYSKRLECLLLIDRESFETSHLFQVIVDHGIEGTFPFLEDAIVNYDKY